METKLHQWGEIIRHEKKNLAISLFFLAVAIALYMLAGSYTTDNGRNAVAPDLILDHVGPYNLNFIFVWLYIVVIAIYFAYPIIFKPRELPFFINMFSLFLVFRSGFVIFTHLRIPYDAMTTRFPSYLEWLNFSNDLFFSGHTGLPFLGFLMLLSPE